MKYKVCAHSPLRNFLIIIVISHNKLCYLMQSVFTLSQIILLPLYIIIFLMYLTNNLVFDNKNFIFIIQLRLKNCNYNLNY